MHERGIMMTASLIMAAALAGWVGSGCSLSTSSGASSQGSSASSKGSSDSLSSNSSAKDSKSDQSYRDDVRDFTSSYARSNPATDQFQIGLAQIAERHGVTNWEAVATTYVGIGEGLRRAGVGAERLDAWKSELSGPDGAKDRFIQQGYDATRG